MEKRYQILYKGIYSNKMTLIEYGNHKDFNDGLSLVKSCKNLQLITTNIYESY